LSWRGVLALLLCAACKQARDAPPPPPPDRPVMAASEVKRGQDACRAYVDHVCACARTNPAMRQPCSLARPLLDAIEVAADVGASPESTRRDSLQANDTVRKIVKECIEQSAKLPAC
jgi:alkanesulfonate monooxygenase SsuD/methylene tetrahydromethanopterin reductase-like flavin-dependent oxidoreductase (luciferase family)